MRTEQRVAWAIRDRSFLMIGDPERKEHDGDALPKLLAKQWVVKSVHSPSAKGHPDDLDTPVTYFVLERGGF